MQKSQKIRLIVMSLEVMHCSVQAPFFMHHHAAAQLHYSIGCTIGASNGKTSIVYYRTLSFFAFRFKKKRKFPFLLLF